MKLKGIEVQSGIFVCFQKKHSKPVVFFERLEIVFIP